MKKKKRIKALEKRIAALETFLLNEKLQETGSGNLCDTHINWMDDISAKGKRKYEK